jgi:hypothetical protein
MDPSLEELQNDLARSLDGLTAEQTQLRPGKAEGKWTIQQIVQHLLLTYSSTDATIKERLTKGRPTRSVPTFSQRCQQMIVIRAGFFPSGRSAPGPVAPPPVSETSYEKISGAGLTEQAACLLAQCDSSLQEAESRFGAGRLATHHILGSLTAAQWSRFHLIHGRHHVKQIWAIRRDHEV